MFYPKSIGLGSKSMSPTGYNYMVESRVPYKICNEVFSSFLRPGSYRHFKNQQTQNFRFFFRYYKSYKDFSFSCNDLSWDEKSDAFLYLFSWRNLFWRYWHYWWLDLEVFNMCKLILFNYMILIMYFSNCWGLLCIVRFWCP